MSWRWLLLHAAELIPRQPLPTTQTEAIKDVGYVDDAANVIDGPSRQELENTLAALKKRKKIDFSVVTVASTAKDSAFDYSLALARERKSKRNDKTVVAGLLLLVAVNDRNWHIQITRNLETDLTKEILTKLSEPMTDSFQQKRYSEGVMKYVNAVIAKLDQIDLPEDSAANN